MSIRTSFRILLGMNFLFLAACGLVAPLPAVTDTTVPPSTGTLVVEIRYTGSWYRETFDYKPDASNIRHIVLAMPVDSDIALASPGWVFTSLQFTPSPEPFLLREEVHEYAPLLKYLYDAPSGAASIELEPGKYNVAVAFIAAPLSSPGGDVILYPGVTGGGASNEFQVLEVVAGTTMKLTIELTDDNGWGYLFGLASR